MLTKTLENIGLNNKEAKVYLAALEIGSSPVSHIASKAKINRVTTYDILEKLSKKGLISSFTRAKVKFFTATEPEVVISDFKRKVGTLEESLPELKKLNGETVQPAIRYFEGIDGIRNIYEDALANESEIRNFGNIKDIKDQWPTYEDDFVKKRVEKEIPLKAITLDDEQGRAVQAEDSNNLRETRLIAPELFDFSNEIFIYGNKVAIISYGEMIGMIIESPEIAKMQRTIFNLVWSFAQEGSDVQIADEVIVETSVAKEVVEDNANTEMNVENPDEGVVDETPEETEETPTVETTAEVTAEPEPETEADPEPETETVPEDESKPENTTEPTVEVETPTESEVSPEQAPAEEPTVEVETTTEPEVSPEPQQETNPTAEPEITAESPEPTPTPEPTPEPPPPSDNYLDPVPNLDEYEQRDHAPISNTEPTNTEQPIVNNEEQPNNNEEQPATPFNNEDQIKLF